MLDLWLVRHGESLGNLDGTEADTALSPRGRRQAAALAGPLARETFDQVLSSPLQRARETAALALPDRAITVEARLRELIVPRERFFDNSRLSLDEMLVLARPTPDDPPTETGKQFMDRVRTWLASLPAAGRIIVFTHAGVVREALQVLLPGTTRVSSVGHAAISRVHVVAGANRLVVLDDRRHAPSGV